MKSRILKRIFSPDGLVVAIGLSILINASDFISGTNDINPIALFAVFLYITYLFTYAVLYKRSKAIIHWSILTIFTAAIGIVISENHLLMDWMIPFAFIFICPFYSLRWLVLGSYTYSYLIVITLSIMILLINLIDVNSDNKEVKKAKTFNYTLAAILSALLICAVLIFCRFKIVGHFTHIGIDKSIPYELTVF
ncbi:MAG: hypothetical protein IJN40_03995 [Clostridia bacterium]|nr:hypothetical protein [Clostridia bacterium]